MRFRGESWHKVVIFHTGRAEALPQDKKSPSVSNSRPLADFHESRQGLRSVPPHLAENPKSDCPTPLPLGEGLFLPSPGGERAGESAPKGYEGV